MRGKQYSLGLLLALWGVGMSFCPMALAQGVDFNRDIRPILSNNCFKCHGPDEEKREADLRLDEASSAIPRSIVAGKPEASPLVERILSSDADKVMPPPTSNKHLTDRDKEIIQRWIREGAPYARHWAFDPPVRPGVPAGEAGLPALASSDSPIDQFIAQPLRGESLSPAPVADSYRLARRAYFDLIGLPPSPAETERFVSDTRPDHYERMIDSLLASPSYGERWARRWLDLARYADTNGYEKDRVRSIWPYRDWVINALNADLPFDRFTLLQLAGDMVPGATLDDRIATGFHRNTMINEEGGVDPNEFRFHAMVDRVSTTGTVWLGLTVGCAQCHTHKYDPITQKDYYQFMAFMNNSDEPEIPVPLPEVTQRQLAVDQTIREYERSAPAFSFKSDDLEWTSLYPTQVSSASQQPAVLLGDGSIRFQGTPPERETYTIEFDSQESDIVALRIHALTDPAFPRGGPGRADNGNFVLSEVQISAGPTDGHTPLVHVPIAFAEAPVRQPGFAPYLAVDGKLDTGWAVGIPGEENRDRFIIIQLAQPMATTSTHWTIRLIQNHGDKHVLGRFRFDAGRFATSSIPIEFRRRQRLEQVFEKWQKRESLYATRWETLQPIQAKSNLPYLTILDDKSVLSSGDQTKSDRYDVRYANSAKGITAFRLEALTDSRLPLQGPGRIFYEGPFGDFFLSEFQIVADGRPIRIRRAIADVANAGNRPEFTLDGNPQTGWSIDGFQGTPHVVIYELDEPIDVDNQLDLSMIFERYYSCGMGRFRLSYTTDLKEERQNVMPADVENALATLAAGRSAEMTQRIRQQFLELAEERTIFREQARQIARQRPEYPTTLVMAERPPEFPRPTHLHHRGEFLQPAEVVLPDLPSAFGRLSKFDKRDRLRFAQWLIEPNHPLTSRVTVNRHWANLFGKGIVRTTEDFGYQGELPSHPELLDWLATEFVERGWSVKELHRLVVTSRTYRQSSAASADAIAKDPNNRWLARGPRVRLEAEQIRDAFLATSGLLTPHVGGPSVFPPQPRGVTSEGAYGPLAWNVSTGGDQYRRSLYTFAKRTAPYAMFTTFDAGSGEACLARREVSNTPLQSLTLLNDPLTLDCARTLGRGLAQGTAPVAEKVNQLYQLCLGRPALPEEQQELERFLEKQRVRFVAAPAASEKIAGVNGSVSQDQALWTLAARAVLNLDEMITKE
jgi:hypothetical protein